MSPLAAPCARSRSPSCCCVSLLSPRGPPGGCFLAQPCYRDNPAGAAKHQAANIRSWLFYICRGTCYSFSNCLFVSFYYHLLGR